MGLGLENKERSKEDQRYYQAFDEHQFGKQCLEPIIIRNDEIVNFYMALILQQSMLLKVYVTKCFGHCYRLH